MPAVHGNAPRLLMVLSSEPVLSLKSDRFFITVTIGYESNEDSGGNHAGCITFADPIMDWTVDKESFSLYSTGPEGHISKIDHED
ncbi:MAG: hypothetical protein M1822_002115 [Bathelium mastoideum]|nr:MAG: hypothetical protein M1822_002115 [Bathelium mastoideum]